MRDDKQAIAVLEHDGWIYRSFWDITRNGSGQAIGQVLQAIFFTLLEMVKLARRFCPDLMIQADSI
jgi:hypothetical protein